MPDVVHGEALMVVAIAAAMYGMYELLFGSEPTAAPMVPHGPPQAPKGPNRDLSVSLPDKETPWWNPAHKNKLFDPWAYFGLERPNDWIITDKDKFNYDCDWIMNHYMQNGEPVDMRTFAFARQACILLSTCQKQAKQLQAGGGTVAHVGVERVLRQLKEMQDAFDNQAAQLKDARNGFDNLSNQYHSQETQNKMRQEELNQYIGLVPFFAVEK